METHFEPMVDDVTGNDNIYSTGYLHCFQVVNALIVSGGHTTSNHDDLVWALCNSVISGQKSSDLFFKMGFKQGKFVCVCLHGWYLELNNIFYLILVIENSRIDTSSRHVQDLKFYFSSMMAV